MKDIMDLKLNAGHQKIWETTTFFLTFSPKEFTNFVTVCKFFKIVIDEYIFFKNFLLRDFKKLRKTHPEMLKYENGDLKKIYQINSFLELSNFEKMEEAKIRIVFEKLSTNFLGKKREIKNFPWLYFLKISMLQEIPREYFKELAKNRRVTGDLKLDTAALFNELLRTHYAEIYSIYAEICSLFKAKAVDNKPFLIMAKEGMADTYLDAYGSEADDKKYHELLESAFVASKTKKAVYARNLGELFTKQCRALKNPGLVDLVEVETCLAFVKTHKAAVHWFEISIDLELKNAGAISLHEQLFQLDNMYTDKTLQLAPGQDKSKEYFNFLLKYCQFAYIFYLWETFSKSVIGSATKEKIHETWLNTMREAASNKNHALAYKIASNLEVLYHKEHLLTPAIIKQINKLKAECSLIILSDSLLPPGNQKKDSSSKKAFITARMKDLVMHARSAVKRLDGDHATKKRILDLDEKFKKENSLNASEISELQSCIISNSIINTPQLKLDTILHS